MGIGSGLNNPSTPDVPLEQVENVMNTDEGKQEFINANQTLLTSLNVTDPGEITTPVVEESTEENVDYNISFSFNTIDLGDLDSQTQDDIKASIIDFYADKLGVDPERIQVKLTQGSVKVNMIILNKNAVVEEEEPIIEEEEPIIEEEEPIIEEEEPIIEEEEPIIEEDGEEITEKIIIKVTVANNKYGFMSNNPDTGLPPHSDESTPEQQASISLKAGQTYEFDMSDPSNNTHPLRLSIVSDGTHSAGTEYTTGVTDNYDNKSSGNDGSFIRIDVTATTPRLYYYCELHPNMGAVLPLQRFNFNFLAQGAPISNELWGTRTNVTTNTLVNDLAKIQIAKGALRWNKLITDMPNPTSVPMIDVQIEQSAGTGNIIGTATYNDEADAIADATDQTVGPNHNRVFKKCTKSMKMWLNKNTVNDKAGNSEQSDKYINDLVCHELGHALGFGLITRLAIDRYKTASGLSNGEGVVTRVNDQQGDRIPLGFAYKVGGTYTSRARHVYTSVTTDENTLLLDGKNTNYKSGTAPTAPAGNTFQDFEITPGVMVDSFTEPPDDNSFSHWKETGTYQPSVTTKYSVFTNAANGDLIPENKSPLVLTAMGNELMTNIAENEGTDMPLSALSAAAMDDLGYVIDYSYCEPYTLGTGA